MTNIACISRGAIIDETGQYRYSLSRVWNGALPTITWVMLNPSKATAVEDDPTLKKCMGFSARWGYGGLKVVNLFAWRATDPDALQTLLPLQAVGSENDRHILEAASLASAIVVAWGNMGNLFQRDQAVLKLLENFQIHCLGVTNSRQPKHPVRLGYHQQRILFEHTATPQAMVGKSGVIAVQPDLAEVPTGMSLSQDTLL